MTMYSKVRRASWVKARSASRPEQQSKQTKKGGEANCEGGRENPANRTAAKFGWRTYSGQMGADGYEGGTKEAGLLQEGVAGGGQKPRRERSLEPDS